MVTVEFQRSVEVGQSFVAEEIGHIEWVLPMDVADAWQIYQQYRDKKWSFTDCVSRVVMERLGIQTAFALSRKHLELALALMPDLDAIRCEVQGELTDIA